MPCWFQQCLETVKALFTEWCSEARSFRRFRTPFSKQRFNGFQTLLKSAGHYYYLIFPWIWDILNWKKSLLVWFVILRLFVNSLTADNKYSRCNLHILTQIQTPLSLKWKAFSGFFIADVKCALNLEHFEYKVEYLSLIISEIIYSERAHYLNV